MLECIALQFGDCLELHCNGSIALRSAICSALQHLNIKQNNIKVAGDRMAEALKSNKTLLSLDFTFNDFSYKSFSSIEQSLQRNMKVFKSTVCPK